MKQKANRNFVWAIDPFEKLKPAHVKFARLLEKKTHFRAVPTYVVSPSVTEISFNVGQITAHNMAHQAKTELERALSKAGIRKPARAFFESELSTSSAARRTAKVAQRDHAQFILASTRGQGGVGLRGIGSYSQALLAVSETPVIVTSPTMKSPRDLKKILFATDFSSASKKAFLRLCEFAQVAGAEVIVCHIFHNPIPWMHDNSGMYFPPPAEVTREFDDEIRREIEAKCDQLVKTAKKLRVKASSMAVKDYRRVDGVILRAASARGADMIAAAAESGKFVRGVLGTTTQKLIRSAPVPVWVYRP